MGVYLAEGQTFEDVVRQDAEILRRSGVTYQQIGDALEKVLNSYNWHSCKESQKVNDTLSISAIQYKGIEECPYDNKLVASRDFLISGLPNGNKVRSSNQEPTLVTEMMPDLIRELHFFEGDVPYGICPEWAIQLYEIVKRDGATPWVPKKEIVYKTGSGISGNSEGILSEDFYGSQKLKATADRKLDLAPGVVLYMKGENGVIFAENSAKLPPNFEIEGIPFKIFENKIYRGQTFVNKEEIIVG